MAVDLLTDLKQQFDLPKFRPGQRQAIESLLSGRDVFVMMPTGRGKSLVYQMAGLRLPGVTVVVSPLIALMKDQTDHLRAREIPATYVNSTLPPERLQRRLQAVAKGQYKFVFVAPERLRSRDFVGAIRTAGLGLLAVDEAHCIVEWGYDFRPDFQLIRDFRRNLGDVVTLALTASATPELQKAIVQDLGLRRPRRIVTGVDRPNLQYSVRHVEHDHKMGVVLELVTGVKRGGAIVYVGTKKEAESIAENLAETLGRSRVGCYHGRLDSAAREDIHNAFRSGKLNVVVATNAFGMGVHRSDVRLVVHYKMPGSLAAYYQQAGRAGRDGEPAQAILLYDPGDHGLQEHLISATAPTAEELWHLADYLRKCAGWYDEVLAQRVRRRLNISPAKFKVLLRRLEASGLVNQVGDKGRLEIDPDWTDDRLQAQIDLVEQQTEYRRSQLDQMIAYAESNEGHRQILRSYFRGDPPGLPAGKSHRQLTTVDRPPAPCWCEIEPEPPNPTLHYYKAGLTPEEIATKRDLKVSTIWGHLARLVGEKEIRLHDLVSPEVEHQVREAMGKIKGRTRPKKRKWIRADDISYVRLKPVKKSLPEDITYGQIQCVVAAELSRER